MMALIAAGLLIGLVIGLVRGGRLRRLKGLHFRWTPVGIIAVCAVVAARWGGLEAPEILLATGLICGALFAFANVHLRGLGVAGIGIIVNLVPLLFHGTVPVDLDALLAVDAVDRAEVGALDDPVDLHLVGGRRVADDDTVLAPLGERIPVPVVGLVVSFGDLITMMGMGAAACNAVQRRRRQGTIPVREILLDDDRAATSAAGRPHHEPTRRQRPIEVERGRPVPVPLGWGPSKDDEGLVGAIHRAGGVPPSGRAAPAAAHPAWPWRRHPPPRPDHPTMRVGRR
ncbi:MAG: DUF5317 family protein [Acidimicrobiia bacterium]|nr:DUF5317 family protein [Acidimicrobiia bacterium]